MSLATGIIPPASGGCGSPDSASPVRELVRTELELAAIVAAYEREERGQPPYYPAMMLALVLYA